MALSTEDLQAIAELLQPVKSEIQSLKDEVKSLNRKIIKMNGELKGMDEAILDEVERVHEFLNKHMQDTSKHTA